MLSGTLRERKVVTVEYQWGGLLCSRKLMPLRIERRRRGGLQRRMKVGNSVQERSAGVGHCRLVSWSTWYPGYQRGRRKPGLQKRRFRRDKRGLWSLQSP